MLHARKLTNAALSACLVATAGIGTTVLTAGAAHAASCPSAAQIGGEINAALTVADNTYNAVIAVTERSPENQVTSTAQSAAGNLEALAGDLSADAGALSGCPALSSADAQTVATDFGELTAVTDILLKYLVDDAYPFEQYVVTAPIAAALRSLVPSYNSFTSALAAVAPAQGSAVTGDGDDFDVAASNAINTYDQLCTPSPQYPNTVPVCVPA